MQHLVCGRSSRNNGQHGSNRTGQPTLLRMNSGGNVWKLALRSLAAAAACAVAGLGGCGVESAVIAAAGVTAGFGLAQGQAEAFINGELKAARMVTFEQAQNAVKSAMEELQVPTQALDAGRYDAQFRGQAEGGPKIKVQLKSKSPMITKIEIRVGFMGDQAVSRLVLSRIDEHLGIQHLLVPPEQSPFVAPNGVSSWRFKADELKADELKADEKMAEPPE